MTNAEIKEETVRLYDQLPIEEEARKARTDIRDKVFELNSSFFGYVASHTFINNPSVTYQDKFQSACMHFMECWWWYRWPVRYRTDLSFSTFFKPRIGEMIERELNEVKYSIRRDLCMEAGKQLGKHWGKVTYDDLKDVKLPAAKMNSLKAIFGTLYFEDLDNYEPYLASSEQTVQHTSKFDEPTDEYDGLVNVLIKEMCDKECLLTDNMLQDLADTLGLKFWDLKHLLPTAEKNLYQYLKEEIEEQEDIDDSFSSSGVMYSDTYSDD